MDHRGGDGRAGRARPAPSRLATAAGGRHRDPRARPDVGTLPGGGAGRGRRRLPHRVELDRLPGPGDARPVRRAAQHRRHLRRLLPRHGAALQPVRLRRRRPVHLQAGRWHVPPAGAVARAPERAPRGAGDGIPAGPSRRGALADPERGARPARGRPPHAGGGGGRTSRAGHLATAAVCRGPGPGVVGDRARRPARLPGMGSGAGVGDLPRGRGGAAGVGRRLGADHDRARGQRSAVPHGRGLGPVVEAEQPRRRPAAVDRRRLRDLTRQGPDHR
ncbi:hypothetical protein [Ornithinimicrobium kibberense]|uniref:hypothetical protein n=1 Tax=Ornithinimicrobium kibberense TaxID=282060 RepID=UPI003620DB51